MQQYKYYNNCVSWPRRDVHAEGGLSDMIDDAIEITRKTFLNHVDRNEMEYLEISLGYSKHHSQGLTMAGDWHVSYHRSRLHGKRAYYFNNSCIEYVFTKQ